LLESVSFYCSNARTAAIPAIPLALLLPTSSKAASLEAQIAADCRPMGAAAVAAINQQATHAGDAFRRA